MSKLTFGVQIPQFRNDLYCVFEVHDQKDNTYYAKICNISAFQEHGLYESLEYNQEVLSDLQGVVFSQHLNKIEYAVANDDRYTYTYVTSAYQTNLQKFMRSHTITQNEALRIFDNVLKAVYAIYVRGYWHKCIRPEHFVKVGDIWKLNSLVYSEDISKCKNLSSQYMWNKQYQPPQAYQRDIHCFTDQQFLPVVVWNLGSLLLDLFFNAHKLNNKQILKCFKDKKFSLQDIKVKKTDLFSKKLKDILAYMLHYNPKSRMKLEQVFANQYLSKQLALLFRQRHKSSLAGLSMKIFTGGRSALSSALISKQERQKGSKILPINQMIKSVINMNPSPNMLKQKQYTKSLVEIETDEDSGDKASLASIFDRFLGKKSPENQSNSKKHQRIFPSNIEELFKNKELQSIIKNYKTIYDKSELLSITGQKFNEVDYKENQKQINLVSKYAVYLMSYLNIKELIQEMNHNTNFLYCDQSLFTSFANSWEYRVFKEIINHKLIEKDEAIKKIKKEIENLGDKQKKIVEEKQIKQFIQIDQNVSSYKQIKTCYRKILKISYDIVTRAYNQNSGEQKLARLAMYIVYCLTIDKLYLPSMIQKNFLPYFQWVHEQPSCYIPIQKLQKYVEQAKIRTLVFHAKEVLQRFFKL